MATDPRLQQSVEDINKSLFGRPVIGVKGPIAPWYGAFKPPSLEDVGFIPNEEWDYRVANRTHGLGMEGQQLPERAKGWDKYGRPYYGEGITGWANKNASNFEADWEEALSRESQFRQFTGGVWAILKNTGMATVLDPLMGIAKGIERGIGISAGLPDIAEESPLPKQKTLPDEPVPEMTEEGTPLVPKMAGSELAARIVMSAPFGIGEYFENIRNQPPPESLTQSAQSFLNRLAPQAANTINTLYDALNPLNVAYNTARVVADKDNYESNIDELEASYHASSILYTTALDPAVREEFVRRANAGEDPGLLAIELENPAAEFAGQMIFDPLNLWVGPGKVAADAAYLKNARTVFVASDEVADAIKTFRLHDEAEAIASLTRLSEASAATAARTIGNRADDLGVLALTANGKRAALVDTAGQVMQSIMYNVDNPDDMLELTQAIARRSSGSADEVAEATAKIMAIAKRANMSPSVLFSPASFDLGYVLREVMKSDPQKFLDETLELINAGDKAAVAENAYRLFDDAAEKIYPSVAKRLADGEDIGFVAEALHKMDKGIFGKTLKAANNVFAHIYMGMSPGYAARNAIMDNFLINLDLGPSNPFSASRWHEAGIKWQGGAITRAAERGISSPVSAAGVTAAEGAGKWTSWGLKMGEAVERNSARLVVGKTIDRTMRQLLGRGLPTLEPILRAGGLSDDIGRFLINTTINNFGDTSIAVNALRSKNVDVWRHISQWLDDDTIKALDGMGLLPSILDSLAMSGNIDDALRNAAAVFDEVDAIANSALDEMPTISRSNPALPDAIALTESGAGDATKLQFGAVIESNNNSMVASLDSMNGVRTKANNMVHSYPQSQHQEISDILGRYTVDEGAWGSLNDFATKNSDVFQSNIKRVRRSRKPLDLIEEWDNLGLNALRGEASAVIADTTIPYNQRKAMFMKEAQDAFVDMKYQFWEAVREELFGQANGLYSEMSQYTMATMGTPLNDSQLQLAAHYYEQAAAYARAFPFEDGLHYFRPPTPRFAVGGAGGETVFAALDDGIKTPEHLLNAINAKDDAGEFLYRSEGMSKKIYKDLTEVNSDMAYDVLYNRRYGKTQERIAGEVAEGGLVREATEEFVKLPPPPTLDGTPSLARALYEQQEAVTGLRKTVLDNLGASRGEILELAHTDEAEEALKLWQESADAQIKESRILSQDVATQTRDFILHDYRSKRNIDTLAGYVYPYQFWYTQTYTKMMKRMARNPAIASNYLRYKDALGKIHAGAPDWWKYTINSNELLGLDMENPLYFNLEASLNPLNGLTGVDFDDPYKRTNWFTGLLMDLGKHGPSTHTLYSLAVAVGLYAQGEEDAANRWAGRIIPQTRTVKAVTALAFDKPVELDPWVALMADGLDPYERNRVGRALGAMANEEKYTEAELFDAANKQSGPLWDEAVLRATKERAPGQISSFFLGVGFKGRTNSDIQIDKFYGDWHRLWELEPNYSPQEMQRAMSDMRKAYPFMDTLMLSKKGGLDRDRAYAYNVLSRIPPSMSDDVAKAAGLNPELLSRFYDAKGHMETWPEQDQDRFMAGMVDIAAVLDMPDNATRDAWINAKDAYKSMLSLGEDNFGSDIWALQDTYYALMGDDPDDRQQAYDFLDANPRLQRAMEWKDQVIMFSPTLSAYYTSLDKIQAYYTGEMYKAIEEELGADIWDQWDEYNAIPEEERRSYWRSHPDLGRYMDIKEDWQDLIAVNTINVGNMIKPGPGPSVRAIMGEMGIGSAGVREFAEQYPTVIDIPDELLLQALGPELYRLYQDDEPLPPAAKEAIEALGLNVEE